MSDPELQARIAELETLCNNTEADLMQMAYDCKAKEERIAELEEQLADYRQLCEATDPLTPKQVKALRSK